MKTVYLFGALRVVLDDVSGRIEAILDAVSGKNASGIFSDRYINEAATRAHLAWASQADH